MNAKQRAEQFLKDKAITIDNIGSENFTSRAFTKFSKFAAAACTAIAVTTSPLSYADQNQMTMQPAYNSTYSAFFQKNEIQDDFFNFVKENNVLQISRITINSQSDIDKLVKQSISTGKKLDIETIKDGKNEHYNVVLSDHQRNKKHDNLIMNNSNGVEISDIVMWDANVSLYHALNKSSEKNDGNTTWDKVKQNIENQAGANAFAALMFAKESNNNQNHKSLGKSKSMIGFMKYWNGETLSEYGGKSVDAAFGYIDREDIKKSDIHELYKIANKAAKSSLSDAVESVKDRIAMGNHYATGDGHVIASDGNVYKSRHSNKEEFFKDINEWKNEKVKQEQQLAQNISTKKKF